MSNYYSNRLKQTVKCNCYIKKTKFDTFDKTHKQNRRIKKKNKCAGDVKCSLKTYKPLMKLNVAELACYQS